MQVILHIHSGHNQNFHDTEVAKDAKFACGSLFPILQLPYQFGGSQVYDVLFFFQSYQY
jgi:hypothetical protein